MFRRISHFIITAFIAAGLLLTGSFQASAAVLTTNDQDYRNQVFRVCGISDCENPEQPVTRAEFAKMLVLCSPQKDLLGPAGVAAASDVPAGHAYSGYIRTALRNSWMRNRLGGNFEPDGYVTLTDAAKAAMTMLGYTDSDFAGNVGSGRLAKFCALNLNDGVSVTGTSDSLTKQDAVNILYNALKTNTKQGGGILGSGISLTLSADGSLNATAVLDNTMKGPILIKNYDEIQKQLPFPISEGVFYYNGVRTGYFYNLQLLSYSSQIDNCGWLIMFYNESTKSVWGYGQDTGDNAYHCVRGTVQTVYYDSENIVSPSSVVVNDVVYSLGSSDAKFMFSVNGTITVGDEVVLICKKNTNTEYSEDGMSTYYVTGVVLYRKRG